MQSKSNLGQLNTQTELQNETCTLSTLKKKKSRMMHIFSTDNTTTVKWNWQRISCWVSAIGMLHNWRILKFLYIDNFWSDESTQSLIYRMCMYKNQPLSISDHKIHLA